MAEVSLQQVVKKYGDVTAVKGISLEIRNKEFVALVGPSGCGKSTTLRMIAGLEEITEGTISIAGRVVNEVHPKDRDIAMVFQSYALYPHMNVFDNMAFGLQLRKMPKAEIAERVGEAARILGLEEYLQRKPKELSGGQRQRVAMGRAIVRRPAVFLFDEPLSNLDAKLRVQMRLEIARLHRKLESTSVYVTHDQVEAMTLADRIVVMKDGLIMQVGTPMELYQHPANLFVATFIGSPSMNLLEGSLQNQKGTLFFQNEHCSLALKDSLQQKLSKTSVEKVTLGVRPQSVMWVEKKTAAIVDKKVEVIEPLGAETFLHIRLDEKQILVVRENNLTSRKIGDNGSVDFNQEEIHFFDTQSGEWLA